MSERQPTEPGGCEPGMEREQDHEHMQRPHPRVWIGSLADYVGGVLTGDWVDAAVDGEELVEAAKIIVAKSHSPGADEWAIFDYEGFGDWKVAQHDQLELVAQVARGIAEHGPAFAAWAELHDADSGMLASFQVAYLGHYESPEAWAADVMDDMGITHELDKAVPDALRPYVQIDYASWAHDAWLEGSIYFADDHRGGVWVFDQNA